MMTCKHKHALAMGSLFFLSAFLCFYFTEYYSLEGCRDDDIGMYVPIGIRITTIII